MEVLYLKMIEARDIAACRPCNPHWNKNDASREASLMAGKQT